MFSKLNQRYLAHHGILGQKWGQRNGPPYPLTGGAYSITEKKEIYKAKINKNSIYNKKHFDKVIDKDKDTLRTLSYDKDRLKNADMFYAAYDKWDKHQYNALFNKPIDTINGPCYKFKIDTKVNNNIKVASEDSAAKVFMNLYSKDRDFYNFVTQSDRMQARFVKDKYKFKGYREAKHVLDKMNDPGYRPTDKDLKTVYRLFNYVIPSDAGGNLKYAKDVANQRIKFFNELKKQGYGAVLDTNDAIYGGFKANSPVIVFDMDKVIPAGIKDTTFTDKRVSELAFGTKKVLGL